MNNGRHLKMINNFQPYVGPKPFERKDQGLFFGRDREANELLSLIIANDVVIVYAESGVGKTSLFNAGLMPRLEKEGIDIFSVGRIGGLAPPAIDFNEISNIFVFNALTSWDKGGEKTDRLLRVSLADFLRKSVTPTGKDGLRSPRVVIFDQFEELFSSHQERWQDRKEFFRQIADALKDDALLRIVFVMQEAFLARLEPYIPLLPDLPTHFRLERLREPTALAAIKKPLENTEYFFEKGAAEKLVHELRKIYTENDAGESMEVSGQFIEPVQLQVVCESLWQDLPPDTKVITQYHLKNFGNVDQALAGFYEKSIQRALQETQIGEGDIRRWFEDKLITPAGTRATVFREQEKTADLSNEIVDLLASQHIIRGEWRSGGQWYELTHDRFLKPIQKSNLKWLKERQGAEKTRQWLQAKADEWQERGQHSEGLLDEVQLLEAEFWLDTPESKQVGRSATLMEFIHASKNAVLSERAVYEAKNAQRLRRMVIALAAVFFLVIFIGFFALMQQRQVERLKLPTVARLLTLHALREQHADKELGALLARQAFFFNKKDKGKFLDEVDNALRRTLTALDPIEGPRILSGHKESVRSVAFSPDGKMVASAGVDRDIWLWNLSQSNSEPVFIGSHGETVRDLAFSPDGKTLTSCSDDATIRLWKIPPDTSIPTTLDNHTDRVWCIAYSPDGHRLASGSADGTVRLWDLQKKKPRSKIVLNHNGRVRCLAFSPDGKTLVSGGDLDTLRTWNLAETKAEPELIVENKGGVSSVAFSPDGKKLAVSCLNESSIQLWDLSGENGADKPLPLDPITLLSDVTGPVFSLAFSSGGRKLASGWGDGNVRLWDLRNLNAKPVVLSGHSSWVWDIAFNPDDKTLASASHDKTVRVWKTSVKELAEQVCEKVGRNLTQEEWQEYVGSGIPYEKTCNK